MATTPGNDDPFDRRVTNQAGLALPTVHPMLQLEKPFFAIGIHIVANRRTAERDSLPQDFLDRRV